MGMRRWLFVAACLVLVACGGGGGGGAGDFTLSASTATFTAARNGPLPPAQTIHLHLTSAGASFVGAGYTDGQPQPQWLDVNITGAGNDFDVHLTIKGTSYP